MTPTDAQLAALAEAAREATPGPWSWSFDGDKSNDWIVGTTDPPHAGFLDASDDAHVGDEHVCSGEDPANARYIAAASPDVVIALLAERDRLRASARRGWEAARRLAALECSTADEDESERELAALGKE